MNQASGISTEPISPEAARPRPVWKRWLSPLAWVVRSSVRIARAALRRAARRAQFASQRQHVATIWPDASGGDVAALIVATAILRHHDRVLWLVARYALRVWRPSTAPDRSTTRPVVLHVTGSFDLGGTQTQIKNLCTGRDARLDHRAIELFPELNYLYRQGVAIERERYSGEGRIARTMGRLVAHTGSRSYNLVQIYKLVKDFRSTQPDVVVGWGHEMSVLTFIAGSLAGVPRIVFCIRTFNPAFGWASDAWGAWLLRWHRAMLPMVAKVIVNSTPLQADHARWVGMPASQIAVCPNGMRFEPLTGQEAAAARCAVRRAYAIAADAIVIANVGRFSAEKGQATLVEANAILLRQRDLPPFVWLLCGDGLTLGSVQAGFAAQNANNVVFTGRTDAVPSMLAASDLFVMPSDFEGMPNAMMEAMAAGLACVSTRRSGAVDVARENEEALYYDARDAHKLAEHLTRLMRDPVDARAMGARAARRVAAFSIDHAKAMFDEILTVVATSPTARG
jgi:glycosyltransferase involved in cell wall biosynthesis